MDFLKNVNPYSLFRLDAFGAILTAFMHGFLLIRFKEFFGMPEDWLFYLAIAACCFAIYSTLCSIIKPKHWRPFLRIIASANISFCFITAYLIFRYFTDLTKFGILYFLVEIIVVVFLSLFELRKAASTE